MASVLKQEREVGLLFPHCNIMSKTCPNCSLALKKTKNQRVTVCIAQIVSSRKVICGIFVTLLLTLVCAKIEK